MSASRIVSIMLDERDHLTRLHCGRVAGLAVTLGQHCALSPRELRILRLAATLHDVGKIGIPDDVLKKNTPFTSADWRVMKTHSAKGERILLATELEGCDQVGLAVRHHHERYDGGGYPDGLAGEAIPILARIIAIADTYDAMARWRGYRYRHPHDAIMRVLQDERGFQHDPYLVTKFANFIEHDSFRVQE